MTEIPKDLPRQLPNSKLLAELPDYLKDKANFNKIQKAIIQAGATKHSHSEVTDWAICVECQKKQRDRAIMMRELGFRTAAHYMLWRKIHEEITRRDKLR